MRFGGLKIGGPRGLCPEMKRVRHVPILAYHNPRHTTWLWALSLRRSISDERRAFRFLGPGGLKFQRTWELQIWAWSVRFMWQESGRYRDHTHQQRSKLSRLLGIDFSDR